MARATPIGPGSIGTPGLHEREAEQVKQQKQPTVSPQDAARIAQQAGFHRLDKNKRKGPQLGDGSQQEYSLPQDDLDHEAWSQERLDKAQSTLTLASAQLGELAKTAEGPGTIAQAVVGSSFLPTEDDMKVMERLAERKAPEPMPMLEEVSTSVGRLFGIELGADIPVGHKVLAAGLVVAGETESVKVSEKALEEKSLAGGIEKVTKRGNQAVSEAQKMSKGISQQLNVQRTFVFKR